MRLPGPQGLVLNPPLSLSAVSLGGTPARTLDIPQLYRDELLFLFFFFPFLLVFHGGAI